MATTTYGVNDALAVKQWARRLAVEALKATDIAPLIGTSANSIIQLKTETKDSGDKVTFGLRMQLNGAGVTEGQSLEGNEESLTTYSDSVVINELAHAVRVKDPEASIDAQRVLFNLREEARMGLTDWFSKRLSVSFFNQVCGYTTQTNTLYTGLNAVTAPTRHIFAGASTNDQTLNSATSDVFNLSLVDYAKEMAMTANPQIRPVRINGRDKYVMYLHPYQVTDLRTATAAGQWLDIQKAVYQGSGSNNPIYTGALGEYNDVVLRMSHDITNGVHSSTGAAQTSVRRAVLLGAQSAAVAFGKRRSASSPYRWVEESFDYERELGVSAQSIMGMKKCVFNNADFGAVVVSTYAVAHT